MESHQAFDPGYQASSCCWGEKPASLLVRLLEGWDPSGRRVLDLGSGEGKNAVHLAALGADVVCVERSERAIANGVAHFGAVRGVHQVLGDIRALPISGAFDLVISYGVVHCLASVDGAERAMAELLEHCGVGGVVVFCAYNDRSHPNFAKAHPGFAPLLLPHQWYIDQFRGLVIDVATDLDLPDRHPDREVDHAHSMTRIIACRKD